MAMTATHHRFPLQCILRHAVTSILYWQLTAKTACAADATRQHAVPSGGNITRMTDIHDIKPALGMGADLTWLFWAAGGLALLSLACLGWKLWQHHKKKPVEVQESPSIPPEVEAYGDLDALSAEIGVDAKQFYFRLSAILRRYIERRYAIPAAEMTTEELLPTVDWLSLEPELAQPLKAFCRESDPIKFADAAAAPERMPRDLEFAKDFVRKTTPNAAAAAEERGH